MDFPKHVVVAAFPRKYYSEFVTDPDGTTKVSGLEGRLLNVLSQVLRFEYNLTIQAENNWGYPTKEGNWTGLIGLVSRNEADLALGSTFMTQERLAVVDFTQQYVIDEITFVSRLPQVLPPGLSYVYPFELTVWIYILAICLVIPLVYGIAYRSKRSYLYTCISFFGGVLRQPIESNEYSQKIFMGSWHLFGLIISFCYTALLASFLTVDLRERPVTDFRELSTVAHQGAYKVFTHPAFIERLANSKSEHFIRLAELIEVNKWLDVSLGYLDTQKYDAKTSFIVPRIPLYLAFGRPPLSTMYISQDACTTMEIGIVVNKRFCCKSMLDKIMVRINHSGIYRKFLSDEFYRSWIRSFKSDINEQNIIISFKDIQGPLMFLAIGWLVSILVLIGEICYARKGGKLQ